jgi:hypothetical protein
VWYSARVCRARTSWALVSRLQSADTVRLLLQAVFTAPAAARDHALVHAARVLLALLDQEPLLSVPLSLYTRTHTHTWEYIPLDRTLILLTFREVLASSLKTFVTIRVTFVNSF